MSEELNQQQELSPEELAEMRKRTLDFYKSRISFMKVQLEYENLAANIEEAKLRGLMATLKMAHITAPPAESEEESINQEKSE